MYNGHSDKWFSSLNNGGKTGSPDCIYYPGFPDDADHTFFRYPPWERPRLEATRKLGVNTVCEKIMEDEGNWVVKFIQGILLEKKPDLEREVAQIP
ncbi:hypothetical protein J6590_106143 [Homalodisca vitripennis]|nr:hypothetical protein J6590_106143 [Homalodisca vitripennis]